jgi:hypothetical protein
MYLKTEVQKVLLLARRAQMGTALAVPISNPSLTLYSIQNIYRKDLTNCFSGVIII